MSEAERLAEDLRRQFMNDDHNFDTMIEASIELRRLSAELEECQAQRRAAFRRIEEQDAELVKVRQQMEAQKDEWLSWEAKRKALEKDAERWQMLPAFIEDHQIDYVRLKKDIDAAMKGTP